MKQIITLLALTMLISCANNSNSVQQNAENDKNTSKNKTVSKNKDGMICKKVKPIGSNFLINKCVPAGQSAADRENIRKRQGGKTTL